MTLINLVLILSIARALGQTTEDYIPRPSLADLAVDHKNALQLFNEFTHDWTLHRNDVIEDRNRQLTHMSRSPYYTEMRTDTSFKFGANKSLLMELMNSENHSPDFRAQLSKAVDQFCVFYVDDEFRLVEKTLIYNKFGFIKENPEKNTYTIVMATYSVNFPEMESDTKKFLKCAAKFRSNDTKCPLAEGISKWDWLAYKIWTKANAITTFMGNSEAKYNQILRQLSDLIAQLPEKYKPAEKCNLWEEKPTGCNAIINPKFGLALGMTETKNYEKLKETEMAKIKHLLSVDVEERTAPVVYCRLSTTEEVQIVLMNWLTKGLINLHLFDNLSDIIIDQRMVDSYIVRDLFFSNPMAKKVVNHARIFVLKDDLEDRKSVV